LAASFCFRVLGDFGFADFLTTRLGAAFLTGAFFAAGLFADTRLAATGFVADAARRVAGIF
jgi:hypothetical protein